MPEPSKGEIRLKAVASGVGPTDLKIRRGSLAAVYPLADRAVLGFETAGVVDAVGDGVTGVAVGDEVAAQLMTLGGEFVVATIWGLKPKSVSGRTPAHCRLRSKPQFECCARSRYRAGRRSCSSAPGDRSE